MKYLGILLWLLGITAFAGDYRIVLPEKSRPWERKAAEELERMLSSSCRGGILIGKRSVTFHVGWTELAKRHAGRLEEEEWRIFSVGNDLVLCGGGSRGTLYAVGVFLERYPGIRWYNMHEELVPVHKDALHLPALDLRGKPAFLLRSFWPDWSEKRDQGRYAAFNRLNAFGPVEISMDYGGAFAYGSPSFVHTFNRYISEKEFASSHPEYFSLSPDGTRNTHPIRGQLCLSCPELENVFWTKLRRYILEDENKADAAGTALPRIYDISQNDNNSLCSCAECTRLRKRYGGVESGLQLFFVNKIARRLKAFRPDLKISTLAYYQTEKLPKGILPEENVLIRLCNTSNNYAGGILGFGEESYRKRLIEWGKLAAALGTWDYGVSFNRYAMGLPYPSEFFLQETLRYYRKHKVRYLFTEREHIYHSDMPVMKTWLHAKLMENPDADFNALMQDFLAGYYGKAAPFLLRYRQTLLVSVKKHRPFITAFSPSPISFTHLDCRTVSECSRLLDQAENAVVDNPVHFRRVREARASIDEAIVIFIRKFNLESPGHGLDLLGAKKRLRQTIRKSIRFYLRPECWPAKEDELKKMELYDSLPEIIPPCKMPQNGIDIPLELANWHAGSTTLLRDPASEMGYAVKVRQDKAPMVVGGYDQQTRTLHYSAILSSAAIRGAGYHWYSFKGLKPRPAGYIYLTNDWHVQFPQSLASMHGNSTEWTIHARIRFTGPGYPYGRKNEENAIFIDRIFLEPLSSSD